MKNVFNLPANVHGGGPVYFTWQKGEHSNYLITTGVDGQLNIFDRHGGRAENIGLSGVCAGIAWNKDGDLLAVINEQTQTLLIWESSSNRMRHIESGLRDALNLLLWSKRNSHLLAITSIKGNLLLYNHHHSRKVPILGKHSKRVVSGAWSDHHLLALVGEDRVLSISNEEGDTLTTTLLKGEPSQVKFGRLIGGGSGAIRSDVELDMMAGDLLPDDRSDVNDECDNCVSIVLNRRQLLLLSVQSPTDQPTVLAFADKYGDLIAYDWLADRNQMLIAFQKGYIVVLSTAISQVGQELAYVKVFKEQLDHIAINQKLGKLAATSGLNVKFIDLADVENIEQIHTLDGGTLSSVCEVEWVEWSADGQMLAFALSSGRLQVFLTKLKLIGSAFQGHTAYLSSLLEVSYYSLSDCGSNDVDSATLSGGLVFKLDLEPQQIAVGSAHLASCINNRVCFYSIELARQSARNGSNVSTVIGEREYASIVRQMKLNHEYAAILFTSGDVLLHLIETPNEKIDANEEDHKESKRFPCDNKQIQVQKYTAIELTQEFLLLCIAANATDDATKSVGSGCCIELFALHEWSVVSIFRHSDPAQLIVSDRTGIRWLLFDSTQTPYVYNAVDENLLPLDCGSSNDSESSRNSENVAHGATTDIFDSSHASVDACLLMRPDFPGRVFCQHWPVGQANAAGEFPLQTTHLLWDQSEAGRHVFVAIDKKHVHVFAMVERSIQGRFVQFVGRCARNPDEQPLLLYDGTLYLHNSQGRFVQRPLPTHYSKRSATRTTAPNDSIDQSGYPIQSNPSSTQLNNSNSSATMATVMEPIYQPFVVRISNPLEHHFVNALRLRRYRALWAYCEQNEASRTSNSSSKSRNSNQPESAVNEWISLVQCALHDLNVSLALKVCRRLGWAGAVTCLKSIQSTEEAILLAGQISELLQLFELAEWLYLHSTRPKFALDMRQRLMQWDASITLAKRLRPIRLRWLHLKQAEQAEFDGEQSIAFEHFGLALQMPTSLSADSAKQNRAQSESKLIEQVQEGLKCGDQHTLRCVAGMARSSAKLGNARRALELATRLSIDSAEASRRETQSGANTPDQAKLGRFRRHLVLEIARLLADAKCLLEAATLFEQVGDFESACLWQLKARNVTKVRELISQAESTGRLSSKVLMHYGRLQESEGRPKEALKAFAKAKQYADCVRLLLDKLNAPDEAVALARDKQVHEAYAMIARYFKKRNDFASVIEFLVRSGEYEEAFSSAASSSLVDHYAVMLLDAYRTELDQYRGRKKITTIVSSEPFVRRSSENENEIGRNKGNLNSLVSIDRLDPIDLLQSESSLPVAQTPEWTQRFQNVAVYYEQERQFLPAGQFYCLSAHLKKGVRLLLQSIGANLDVGEHRISGLTTPSYSAPVVAIPNDSTSGSMIVTSQSLDKERLALQLAVQFAPESNDERCLRSLIDVLLGEQDGRPKDFRLLLQLHLRCGQSREAVRVALLLAREQQSAGAYREAHALLRSVCVQLRAIESHTMLPSTLMDALHSLHCYQLLRLAIGANRLRLAASLLNKLCVQLGRFQNQAGSLLASAVVTNLKLGRRSVAKQYAAQLLRRPEWANQVNPQIRRKIETLVRRSALNRPMSNDRLSFGHEPINGGQSLTGDRQSFESVSITSSISYIKKEMKPEAKNGDDEEAEQLVEQSIVCAHCNQLIPPMQFKCDSCRASVCFCVLSGCAVQSDQFAICKGCHLPMIIIQLAFWKRLGLTVCAMCGHSLPDYDEDAVDSAELPMIG